METCAHTGGQNISLFDIIHPLVYSMVHWPKQDTANQNVASYHYPPDTVGLHDGCRFYAFQFVESLATGEA